MFIEIVVFRLRKAAGKELDSAKQWLDGFRAYFKHRDQTEIPLKLIDGEDPLDAPWIGSPFILVGSIEDVKAFFARQSAAAKKIIVDCAYYWILTGTDQEEARQHLTFDVSDRTIVLNWHHKNFEVVAGRLIVLREHPRLTGLSRGIHRVRLEVSRIAKTNKLGPWSP